MDYTLAILTHGDGRTLRRTLETFNERVTPAPAAIRVFCDGMETLAYENATRVVTEEFPGLQVEDRLGFAATHVSRQMGFCGATRRLWEIAVERKRSEYVFWLEHDFVFLRDVDLAEMAVVLDNDPQMAQMALIRDPVNSVEVAAGGLVASRPGEFLKASIGEVVNGEIQPLVSYLEQRSYFTTNPSLMRREFMARNPWPHDELDQCEGRFGLSLVALGYHFGAWGDGSEWVAHMGIRDRLGFGY